MRRLVPPALLAAAALAACGGGGDAKGEIEDVLQRGLTARDAKVVCEESYSAAFVERVYGSVKRCRAVEQADAEDDDPARSVTVSATKVDGGRATATVALKGGTQDGAKGPLRLVDEDGDWRIDDLSVALLRSEFRAGLRTDRQLGAKTRSCLREQVLGLGDDDFRELAYGSIGERADAQQRLVQLLGACQDGGDPVRARFEDGLRGSLRRRGATADQIACVIRQVRAGIDDDELADAVGGSGATPAIRRAVAAALTGCGATG